MGDFRRLRGARAELFLRHPAPHVLDAAPGPVEVIRGGDGPGRLVRAAERAGKRDGAATAVVMRGS
ncbi:hypothetical protein ACIQ7S_04705 [Streptomyces griseoluteus]|uniref:hypothetical protein n=1 Tax=Streptomyces griseoluteus TaxID=29306 RepID=UPI00331A0479